MNKGEFQITRNKSTYCFTFPDKKHFKEIFNKIYPDTSELSFYISNYNGSNTYFGDSQWEKHGIDFRKGKKEKTYIFKNKAIDFIIKDKIDVINIAICKGENPERENVTEVIKIRNDNTLSIYSTDFNVICKCLVHHIKYPLYFDFSKRYDEDKFFNFVKTILNKDFTGKGQVFYKSLKIKKGFNFKINLEKDLDKKVYFEAGFRNNEWYLEQIGSETEHKELNKLPKLERINYFYVSIFFLVVISGILLISTKLRFNILIFSFAGLLFFSLLKYIYKKVKVIFGFRLAVKHK